MKANLMPIKNVKARRSEIEAAEALAILEESLSYYHPEAPSNAAADHEGDSSVVDYYEAA